MTRNLEFADGEKYHVFNRGVDKHIIFQDKKDIDRFLQSMKEFNRIEPIGSIYENRFNKNELGNPVSKLVDFVCYCLNPNHFHFILEQTSDKGIEKFMQRLLGYTKYFNNRYKRSGVLFQGPFKAVYISSNEQLLHTSVYVNLNDKVHKLGNGVSKSSWEEYVGSEKKEICNKDIILGQFNNFGEYKKFANSSLRWIRENKEEARYLIEE